MKKHRLDLKALGSTWECALCTGRLGDSDADVLRTTLQQAVRLYPQLKCIFRLSTAKFQLFLFTRLLINIF